MKISAIVGSRNDDYGGHLIERASHCINSLIDTFDEVWYVDWNTPTDRVPLLHQISDTIEFKGNLHYIVVDTNTVSRLTKHDPHAQRFCEVLARNLGVRRATGDYIVSTNIDVIAPTRSDLLNTIHTEMNENTFYTISRRGVAKDIYLEFSDWRELRTHLYETVQPREFQEKICAGDDFSMINCCGDFQVAHRDVWNTIRGFEESLIYCLYTDTNVQKKAYDFGYQLKALFEPPVFHLDHGKGGGGFLDGFNLKTNDPNVAIGMKGTQNSDTWGFSEVDVEYQIL